MANDLTYDDVMLHWAIAELLSPTWVRYWKGRPFDELRAKLKKSPTCHLSDYEQTGLIRSIESFRVSIISTYGPFRSWSFRKITVSREELSSFSIIKQFEYPTSFSFGDFSTRIKNDPSAERDIHDAVREMLNLAHRGQVPFGLPIAIAREAPAFRLLIEGYKRSMMALWDDWASIEIYLCIPPTALAAVTP